MAKIKDQSNNTEFSVRPEHVVGRLPNHAHTQLKNPITSRVHAVIFWDGKSWKIRDFSTNGTYINSRRLNKNEPTKLHTNDVIFFGNSCNEPFLVIDTSPPNALLIPKFNSTRTIELNAPLCLGSEGENEITLSPTKTGNWTWKSNKNSGKLKTGDIIGDRQSQWEFIGASPDTQPTALGAESASLNPIRFLFNVSPNEERITLLVSFNNNVIDLGERTHHYLLLTLAKKRLADIEAGLPPEEQGWYKKKQLDQNLGISERHSNIQIFRFRKQLADLFMNHYSMSLVIERRKGELRFGNVEIKIKGGQECTIGSPSHAASQ